MAAGVIDEWDGIVDKFLGDGAVALFIPGFAGSDHAADAIAAARGLLEQTGNGGPEPWLPIGVGVHTGTSFVGTVGAGDARDFTPLGDTVNTASRLTGLAGAGEIWSALRQPPREASRRGDSNDARWSYAEGNRASTRGFQRLRRKTRRGGFGQAAEALVRLAG